MWSTTEYSISRIGVNEIVVVLLEEIQVRGLGSPGIFSESLLSYFRRVPAMTSRISPRVQSPR